MALAIGQRPYTVEEYYRLAETGVLAPDARVELLDGEIAPMSPIGDGHASSVTFSTDAFYAHLSGRAVIRVQNPVWLSPYSEPQPDVALVRLPRQKYARGHPRPQDVYLIVEVADTSAVHDRTVKARLYARAGIPELWVVDLPEATVWVYRDPSPEGYRTLVAVRQGEVIRPVSFPEVTILASDLLGE